MKKRRVVKARSRTAIWPRRVYAVVWFKNRAIESIQFTKSDADIRRSNLNAVESFSAFVKPCLVTFPTPSKRRAK